jgi:hypothetical protein
LHAVTGVTRESDDHTIETAYFLAARTRRDALSTDNRTPSPVGLLGWAADLAGH